MTRFQKVQYFSSRRLITLPTCQLSKKPCQLSPHPDYRNRVSKHTTMAIKATPSTKAAAMIMFIRKSPEASG